MNRVLKLFILPILFIIVLFTPVFISWVYGQPQILLLYIISLPISVVMFQEIRKTLKK